MQKIEIPKFKIRCSGIGQIMTESRGKTKVQKIAELEAEIKEKSDKLLVAKPGLKTTDNLAEKIKTLESSLIELYNEPDKPNLSETCKSFLEKWLTEKLYGRKIEVQAKEMVKGNLVEDDSMIYLSGFIPEMGLVSKNEKRFENSFMIGTPDIITDFKIYDVKNAYSHETFPLYETDLPEPDYDWQLRGYMQLANREISAIVYALMNMPEHMIEKEARWKLGNEFSKAEYEAFARNYRYDDLPPYLRIREYEVTHEPQKIESIESRVLQCRDYIKDVLLPIVSEQQKKYIYLQY